jgi:hypothetical protein
MPEKLRFEQRFWNAAAVDRHERPVQTSALGVNELSDDFFADPRLAKDENLGLRSGGGLDVSPELDQCRALAE